MVIFKTQMPWFFQSVLPLVRRTKIRIETREKVSDMWIGINAWSNLNSLSWPKCILWAEMISKVFNAPYLWTNDTACRNSQVFSNVSADYKYKSEIML